MDKQYFIYILTNYNKTSLYIGLTNNLERRVYEHKNKVNKGFTSKYYVDKLIYYEIFDNAEYAIAREKQLKGGSKQKKIDLINSFNPEWKDLYNDIIS